MQVEHHHAHLPPPEYYKARREAFKNRHNHWTGAGEVRGSGCGGQVNGRDREASRDLLDIYLIYNKSLLAGITYCFKLNQLLKTSFRSAYTGEGVVQGKRFGIESSIH